MFAIEKIKEFQLEEVRILIHKTISDCYPKIYAPEVVNFFLDYHSLEEIKRRQSIGLMVVLIENKVLLGTGFLVDDELGGAYIHPDHQGKGMGTAIIKYLVDEARKLGLKRVWMDATPLAQPLYTKLGFNIVSPMVQMVDNVPLNYFKMDMVLESY